LVIISVPTSPVGEGFHLSEDCDNNHIDD